jgi:hypothetical protein
MRLDVNFMPSILFSIRMKIAARETLPERQKHAIEKGCFWRVFSGTTYHYCEIHTSLPFSLFSNNTCRERPAVEHSSVGEELTRVQMVHNTERR